MSPACFSKHLSRSTSCQISKSLIFDCKVLEDLEALVKLLSTRAHNAEFTAEKLQQELTASRAATDRASKDHLASSKQADSLKKEASAAKRVSLTYAMHSGPNV